MNSNPGSCPSFDNPNTMLDRACLVYHVKQRQRETGRVLREVRWNHEHSTVHGDTSPSAGGDSSSSRTYVLNCAIFVNDTAINLSMNFFLGIYLKKYKRRNAQQDEV